MKVSDNFSRSEFACKCRCGFDCVDAELVNVLEVVRFHFNTIYKNVIIKITSGNRCEKHNSRIVGASSNSKHTKGTACDFTVLYDGNLLVDPVDVYDFLDSISQGRWGLGLYKNRVHLDMRKDKARWDNRK